MALLDGLPMDSALRRAVDPQASWTSADEMLATLVELTDLANRRFFAVHFEGEPANPLRVARPGTPVTASAPPAPPAMPSAPAMSSKDEMRAFFGGSVRYRGGS